jgi:ABC-type glucose/galactose transport system permease subunit
MVEAAVNSSRSLSGWVWRVVGVLVGVLLLAALLYGLAQVVTLLNGGVQV